jgi:hypothetical protein
VKYNRVALINAGERLIKASKKAWEEDNARHLRREEAREQEWIARHGAAWHEAALVIRRKIAKNQPVTLADLPTTHAGRVGGVALHQPNAEMQPWAPPTGVEATLQCLHAIDSDMVTPRQLNEVGVDTQVLRRIAPYLLAGSVTA